MNLSMRWLSDYVKVERPIEEYIEDITMSGTKVESYMREDDHIHNVVVGKVLSVVPHNNADSLVICQLDVGAEAPIQIVTGAKNVVAGAMVPVALHKSTLPNGTQIKRGKLRGEVSDGMLCSLAELNLTKNDFPYADEDGIFLLEEDCQVGQPIQSAIGLDDTVIEFEITSNRPDCLAVLGLARETAATYGQEFTMPEIKVQGGGRPIEEILSVTVENTEICQRYMATAVENVKIGPSPRWMRERLRASGVRPINNIVDITNYVMLEYGHPLHAFDLRHVEDATLVIRNAQEGEKITTLDGEERTLTSSMLVIADSKAPSAVAGVMGGEYSGVYEDTQTVIFEAACFDGPAVRRTAKALGMRTESSGRFEKGLDSRNCENAIRRACELVELLGIGTVATGVIDLDYNQKEPVRVPFEPAWMNEFLGVQIPEEEMKHILHLLGFKVEGSEVVVPSFRSGDITCRNDIAEEVIRIYGYNRIPTTVLRGESKGLVTREQHFRKRVANVMIAQGYSEIKTYSFFSPKNYDKIRLAENSPQRDSILIRNPLGEDTSLLRTTAIPSMLGVLSHNFNNQNAQSAFFEIATCYLPTMEGELPQEPKRIILGEYGKQSDFFTLKGGVEALLDQCGISSVEWIAVHDNPTFHTGRCAELRLDNDIIGVVGEVHPKVAENFNISSHVYVAELDYEKLLSASQEDYIFTPLPRYPASTRDLALVCDRSLPVGTIEHTIRENAGKLLEKVALFDVYQGDQIADNQKSVAYSLLFRGEDRTLTDKECDDAVAKILRALEEIGVTLRS